MLSLGVQYLCASKQGPSCKRIIKQNFLCEMEDHFMSSLLVLSVFQSHFIHSRTADMNCFAMKLSIGVLLT